MSVGIDPPGGNQARRGLALESIYEWLKARGRGSQALASGPTVYGVLAGASAPAIFS